MPTCDETRDVCLPRLPWSICSRPLRHASEDEPPADQPTQPERAVPTGPGSARLEEVVVEAKKPVSAASSDEINARTFELRPHETLQEVLNNVPGLIVRQHQGGGKATQYLIRGFNADHGTDFLVTVDGLPVNLVTHAHGQGYADANFIIPETIETLQLRKGPYFPSCGDWRRPARSTSSPRSPSTRTSSSPKAGSFDRMRYVAGVSPKLGGVQTLLATQAYYSNGPFENDEHFARYNGYAKLSVDPTADSRLWAAATIYQGDWDGSGQIPGRGVSAGWLDRFGAIDPTEGGRTDRENLDLHYDWTPTRSTRGRSRPTARATSCASGPTSRSSRTAASASSRRRPAASPTSASTARPRRLAVDPRRRPRAERLPLALRRARQLHPRLPARRADEHQDRHRDPQRRHRRRRAPPGEARALLHGEQGARRGELLRHLPLAAGLLHRLAPLRGRAPRRRVHLRRARTACRSRRPTRASRPSPSPARPPTRSSARRRTSSSRPSRTPTST